MISEISIVGDISTKYNENAIIYRENVGQDLTFGRYPQKQCNTIIVAEDNKQRIAHTYRIIEPNRNTFTSFVNDNSLDVDSLLSMHNVENIEDLGQLVFMIIDSFSRRYNEFCDAYMSAENDFRHDIAELHLNNRHMREQIAYEHLSCMRRMHEETNSIIKALEKQLQDLTAEFKKQMCVDQSAEAVQSVSMTEKSGAYFRSQYDDQRRLIINNITKTVKGLQDSITEENLRYENMVRQLFSSIQNQEWDRRELWRKQEMDVINGFYATMEAEFPVERMKAFFVRLERLDYRHLKPPYYHFKPFNIMLGYAYVPIAFDRIKEASGNSSILSWLREKYSFLGYDFHRNSLKVPYIVDIDKGMTILMKLNDSNENQIRDNGSLISTSNCKTQSERNAEIKLFPAHDANMLTRMSSDYNEMIHRQEYSDILEFARNRNYHTIYIHQNHKYSGINEKREKWRKAIRACSAIMYKYADYYYNVIFVVNDKETEEIGNQELCYVAPEMRTAKKTDWYNLHEMPEQNVSFKVPLKLSVFQRQALKKGNIPLEQEDKWFWYMEKDVLYAHRSWTGYCIYIVTFDDDDINVIANRDPEQYLCNSIEEDMHIIMSLILFWSGIKYNYNGDY